MAVASMLKVTVFGYRPVMAEVVSALQAAGVIQIDTTSFDLETEVVSPDDPRVRALDEQLAEAHFLRDFLGRYHVNEQPFSAFVSEKFHLSSDDYLNLHFDETNKLVYRECVRISDRLASGEREIDRLKQLLEDLAPWAGLHQPIALWRGTETTVLFTGTVPAGDALAIRQALRDAVTEVTVDELGIAGDRQAWVVIAHKSRLAEVRAVLAGTAFTEVSFPELTGTPAEEIERAEARLEELAREAEELEARAQELGDTEYDRAVALVEAIASQRDQLTVRRSFGRTERVFAVSGWIVADQTAALEGALEPYSADVDLTLEEPAEGDPVPVELRNPKWLEPFEVLTDLYGRPQYGELDPTPLLAPFFTIFFGICIGDFGYGLMLIGASWLIKTKLDVTPGVKRFMDLLIYGGMAAMVVGVLFGSYFALPADVLPPFLLRLQVLDPLAELTTFLIITMLLGVTQVLFGVVVAAADAFRRGDPSGAVFGQLSTLWFFGMIAAFVVTGEGALLSFGLVGTMLMQGGALQSALGASDRPVWDRALGWVWLAIAIASGVMMGLGSTGLWIGILGGASVVLAIVSKTARSAVIGLLGGAYAVYGMSAFVGDTLSYTRLAALGLSGALVGMVFNVLAELVWDPARALMSSGGMGIMWGALIALAAIAIFVVGHVFNVVINLLGAFVHPARLQFVEFFSKFYEGGGRPFAPFRVRSENLVLEAGAAGSEGGAG